MKKCIVTGGAGFIGSHVVDLLAKEGYEVLVIDNFSTGSEENLLPNRKNVTWSTADISTNWNMIGLFQAFKPDCVVHLAAQAAITTAMDDPLLDLETNAKGTLITVKAAENFGVERFIYASTSAVYGDSRTFPLSETTPSHPSNYYGISKLAGEAYVRTANLQNKTILRLGNVYGPRQVPIGENQVIARMMRHFRRGDTFEIFGDGKQKRDFIYVADVARAILIALNKKGGVYNIAGGGSCSINELARLVADICGVPGYPWSYNRSKMDPRWNIEMVIDKAKNELGWEPRIDMRVGLRETLDWWKLLK